MRGSHHDLRPVSQTTLNASVCQNARVSHRSPGHWTLLLTRQKEPALTWTVFRHAQADLKEQFADVCVQELSIDVANGREILSYAGWSRHKRYAERLSDATHPLWNHCRQADALGRWYLWRIGFLYEFDNFLVSGCFCPMEGTS
jgi:hypothetical protein